MSDLGSSNKVISSTGKVLDFNTNEFERDL